MLLDPLQANVESLSWDFGEIRIQDYLDLLTIHGISNVVPLSSLVETLKDAHGPPTSTSEIRSFEDLPPEIFLECIEFMPLKSLILCRSICKEWRCLVPLAHLHPLRRRLLELYDSVINAPYFLLTRPWTVNHLRYFDRQAYIDTLLAQYHVIPDAFHIWILEWPARAAICSLWPGLPFINSRSENIQQRMGALFLSRIPPELSAVVNQHQFPRVEFSPALLIWRESILTAWLMFDENPYLFGRVLVLNRMDLGLNGDPGTIPPPARYEDEDEDEDEEDEEDITIPPPVRYEDEDEQDEEELVYTHYADWISYQEACWAGEGGASTSRYVRLGNLYSQSNSYSDQPTELDGSSLGTFFTSIPAPPWCRRQEPIFQSRLLRSPS